MIASCESKSESNWDFLKIAEQTSVAHFPTSKVQSSSGTNSVVRAPTSDEENAPTKTMLESYAFYQRGLSSDEIARQRNCTSETIESHLIDCIRAGYPIDIAKFVSDAQRALIQTAIAEHGTEKLKPLHERLPETITYNMIRFVIAERRQLEKSGADANKARPTGNHRLPSGY